MLNGCRTIALISALGLGALAGCDLLKGKGKDQPATEATPAPAARRADVPESQILARVGDAVIAMDDFKQRVAQLPEAAEGAGGLGGVLSKPKTFDEKRSLLEVLVREELWFQDAEARGLDRDPEVRRRIDTLRRAVLIDEAVKREFGAVDVSSKEIEEFYEQNKAALQEPGKFKVRQIVTKTEDEAKQLLVQLLQGADFAGLARAHSTDPHATAGGDLGTITRGQMFPQFDAALEALDVGQVSGVIKGPNGYHLIKLESREAPRQRPLSELWDELKQGLLLLKRQQRLEKRSGEQRNQTKVTLFEQRLEAAE